MKIDTNTLINSITGRARALLEIMSVIRKNENEISSEARTEIASQIARKLAIDNPEIKEELDGLNLTPAQQSELKSVIEKIIAFFKSILAREQISSNSPAI